MKFCLDAEEIFDSRGSYNLVSRTLCPSSLYRGGGADEGLVVSVSTSSLQNVSFTVLAELQQDFEFGLDEVRSASVSPSQPKFFSFEFPTGISTILLEADSPDDTCMTISLQDRKVCSTFLVTTRC